MNSFLVCRHGGIIEPIDSGQDLTYEEEPVMEKLEIEEVLSTNPEDINTLEDIDKFLNDFEGAFINDNKELFDAYKKILQKNDNNRDKARKEFREYMLNNDIDIPNLYDYTIKICDIISKSIFIQDNKVHIAFLKDEFSIDNLKGTLFETNIKHFAIIGYNFINLVNTNKPLDLKNRIDKEYNDSIWAMPFDFKGECVNPEIIKNGLRPDYIGNFMFGYVGDEIFGYDWFIKFGAGGAQIFSDISNYGFEKYFDKLKNNEYTFYFDNKGDSETIQDGINAKTLHNKK
ncbi:polymorphic toxin type 44 domain-containing protein [[Clostridium] colinum]|uniref:polymorphic toxin type 44 domain-containing protein n=1 Tax=[Clostridium] colinum TaxID=36835 RepID=UPI0020251888|nr:polymorphic toxin type 44 domain-containing protein [[Clostridium] colinum]